MSEAKDDTRYREHRDLSFCELRWSTSKFRDKQIDWQIYEIYGKVKKNESTRVNTQINEASQAAKEAKLKWNKN